MGAAEGQMVRADLVQEIVARRERGESTRQIARELAMDRKTVRRWLRIGGWQPRQGGERPRAIDPYIEFVEQRGPEVGWTEWCCIGNWWRWGSVAVTSRCSDC
jgi:transposase